ncbi:pheromone A receptor-domain-containing protein [Vararia minispora EC-137]|uniref:Pheromone A receptor-domain-containing protein n=1 Tax=Vararia minispora EC-137 TaxID=1314806 RepID=A0ACB8Q739_9AGAM|nr:pheromone A receptor-domain-containing protein [Vararia minispora EC-137]
MAADPTYPLFPIFATTSAAPLLLVLTTSFVRQSWNLGVLFLCSWLFWELLTLAINAIVWADDAGVRLYIYCDIGTTLGVHIRDRLRETWRSYTLADLYLDISSNMQNCGNAICLAARPLNLHASLLDYIQQSARFQVLEGYGCANSYNTSCFTIITVHSWTVTLPSVSILFYCRAYITADTNEFLQNDTSVSRPSYFRLLALASVDAVLTLPIGIANVIEQTYNFAPGHSFPLFVGWTLTHSDWAPISVSYADIQAAGSWSFTNYYLGSWSSGALALVMFSLFGLTPEARATY